MCAAHGDRDAVCVDVNTLGSSVRDTNYFAAGAECCALYYCSYFPFFQVTFFSDPAQDFHAQQNSARDNTDNSELQAELSVRGLSTSGKKPELVVRLNAALSAGEGLVAVPVLVAVVGLVGGEGLEDISVLVAAIVVVAGEGPVAD